MKKSLMLLGMLTSLFFACKNSSEPANDTVTNKKQEATHHHAEHSEQAPVLLNNGQKWSANAETTEGIKKIDALLEAFPDNAKTEDFHSLKIQLQNEFDTILQKCTMTGEAHNQLHNYLLPMQKMIEKLTSDSPEEYKTSLEKLKAHIAEYDNYFQ